ncbi:MAG: Gfo/Idh/MocA family oxidoreductase [Bryobacteraceae bacterium]|nr:Gfo/Idh/MocA family oxidoreductase [Bryobacteraceae bacterium]
MIRNLIALWMTAAALSAQEVKIAVVGLVHSHVWGHLGTILKGQHASLAGIAETEPELIAEAKRRGAPESAFHADWRKMIDQTKPQIVWAFVENNRHLEIVEYCAPRKVHVIFEKPLASEWRDALKIQELARRHGIQVMTNYQMAWWAPNYAAKKLADSGELGRVWRLRGVVGHGGPGGPTGLNKWFFNWLTDPVKNGAGSLMDFGCYNALWSLWYLGRPETVYAQTNQLRPETFPKVEDNATMILKYRNGVGLFEGSWDLPRSFQDLEVFGLGGSVYMTREAIKVRKGRAPEESPSVEPLPAERAEPIAYMVDRVKSGKPLEGLVALDINVEVVEIIEAAKRSVATGAAVKLPLAK